MFNDIATTYNIVNTFMTFGLDRIWRRALIRCLPTSCDALLDVASGTMDVAICVTKQRPDIGRIVAMDMAENMLNIGVKRCNRGQINTIESCVGDAHHIPFNDHEFDAVTVSFGIRNFDQLPVAFKEMHRVLNDGGHLVILESNQPSSAIMRAVNTLYLRSWVRLIGWMVSGNLSSYTYLAESIRAFYRPHDLQSMLRDAGFKTVTVSTHMMESVQIIHAIR